MLLIDTNKYLSFFQSDRISTFVPALLNLRRHVFVSQLIVDEVERNKVSCFQQGMDRLKTPKWSFPDNLLPPGEEADKLREEVQTFSNSAEALSRRLTSHFAELSKAVANSTDHISKQLAQFFGEATSPSDEQLRRARYRKEVNNPPGKRSDPLGDELTWEQFLDASEDARDIWIVSADQDYFVKVDKQLLLNPLLLRDLRGRAVRESVNCFETLAQAIPHFLNKKGLSKEGLPPEEDLAELDAEERSLPPAAFAPQVTPAPWLGGQSISRPTYCHRCNSRDSFNAGSYLRSQYGGLTLQFSCMKCGYHLDTGDSFD